MLEIFQIHFISQAKLLRVSSWLLEIRFCRTSEAWNPFVMSHRATFLYVSFLHGSQKSSQSQSQIFKQGSDFLDSTAAN